MSSLRLLAVAFALVAAASLAVGGAGFSDVSAERGVQISVVDDESAYVGVTACTQAEGQGNVVRLRVTNRFVAPFHVTAVTSDDADVHQSWSEQQDGNTEVAPGENETFTQKFADAVETVEVVVTGDGFEATVTSDVEQSNAADCPGERTSHAGGQGESPDAATSENDSTGGTSADNEDSTPNDASSEEDSTGDATTDEAGDESDD